MPRKSMKKPKVRVKAHKRGPRKGGFLGTLAGAVLPAILGPIAQRIFGRKGEGRKRKRAGNLAAPYAGSRKRASRARGGAILTPGPLA